MTVEDDMKNGHIPTERLVAFMLVELSLAEHEHEHIAHCPSCVRAMVDGTLTELTESEVPQAA
jgi:hypothetical protein